MFRVPCSVFRVSCPVLCVPCFVSRAHGAVSVRTRPPRAHRAGFSHVPCAPGASPRTGLSPCARGGGPEVLGQSLSLRTERGSLADGRLLRSGRRWQGSTQKPRPSHLCPLRRQPAPLSHMGSPAVCSALRNPTSKVGVFSALFTPASWVAPDPGAALFPPSKVHLPTIKQVRRTSQRRFCSAQSCNRSSYRNGRFSVQDGLACASRTGERRFLYRKVRGIRAAE